MCSMLYPTLVEINIFLCFLNDNNHSFETQLDGRPGLMIRSRVRWVDPGQPKKKSRSETRVFDKSNKDF
jgi:hypothetical protein